MSQNTMDGDTCRVAWRWQNCQKQYGMNQRHEQRCLIVELDYLCWINVSKRYTLHHLTLYSFVLTGVGLRLEPKIPINYWKLYGMSKKTMDGDIVVWSWITNELDMQQGGVVEVLFLMESFEVNVQISALSIFITCDVTTHCNLLLITE